MIKNKPVLVGSGRYIQSENALQCAGSEVESIGKKAFILGDPKALCAAFSILEQNLKDAKINYTVREFKGHCTMLQIERYANEASKFGAEVIIGIGGGKSLDTAKATANSLNTGVITIPTSAATCAAYTPLSIVYTERGEVCGNLHLRREISSIIVDTSIISKNCPARLLASGMGDSLAKYPEILFTKTYFQNSEDFILTSAALQLSGLSTDIIIDKGIQAYEDVLLHMNTSAVEDITFINVAITGQISGLAGGIKQLALAHSFYNAICAHFKEQQMSFFHGELVSVGILFQMKANDCPGSKIDETRAFLKSIGIPVCLKDINLEASGRNIDTIVNFIYKDININDSMLRKKIKESIDIIG